MAGKKMNSFMETTSSRPQKKKIEAKKSESMPKKRHIAKDSIASSTKSRPQNLEKRKRLPQKKKKRKKSSKRAILILCVLILVASVAGFLGYRYLRVDKICVSGNETIASEEIVQLSGLQQGMHVFHVDREKVKEKIESNAHLVLLDVQYRFPNEITILVKERKEVAQIALGGEYVFIDEEAVVLGKAEKNDIPEIKGIGIQETVAGGVLKMDDTLKRSVLISLLQELKKADLLDQIALIQIDRIHDLRLQTKQNLEIRLGMAENLGKKLQWAVSVIPVLKKQGKTGGVLDITSVDQATYLAPSAAPSEDLAS